MEALARIEHLSRYYGDRCAVQDLSFSLQRGEVLGLLGPNGAGKSTTLQLITGNLAPSSGSIEIGAADQRLQPLQAKAQLGYLPDHPPLYMDMTVDAYLAYCMRLRRISPPARERTMDVAKQRCGLGEIGGRLIGNLSKGNRQRVGIAQAIIHQPALVILDEPTVGLDPIQIIEVRRLIRELGKDHGVILSTHLLPEVQSTCTRVLILNQGREVFAQTLDSLSGTEHPTTLLVVLETPPDIDRLQGLPGVERVDAITSQQFRLHLAPGSDPRSRIARVLVDNGWGLLEMLSETSPLERTFLSLTSGAAA